MASNSLFSSGCFPLTRFGTTAIAFAVAGEALVSTGGAACFSAGFIGDALGAAFGAPLATAFCLGCALAAVGLFWPAAASASLSWLFFDLKYGTVITMTVA